MSETPLLPGAPTAASRLAGWHPARFAAILRYTLRSCIPVRRWTGVLVACAGSLLFGALSHAGEATPARAFANVAAEGIFSLTMPIAALIIGDAVLGAEIRAGTFHFTWLSPVSPGPIVAGRWMGGSLVGLVTIAPAAALAAVVAGAPEVAGPAFAAAAAGSIAYIAVFIAVGCFTRRTAVWSLAIVFLVERLLGAALSGIAQWSPTWLARAVYVGLADDVPGRLERSGVPDGWDAVARLALVSVVALGLAVWRMRHLRLSGAAD